MELMSVIPAVLTAALMTAPAEYLQDSDPGIEIIFEDGNEPICNAEFVLYRIAEKIICRKDGTIYESYEELVEGVDHDRFDENSNLYTARIIEAYQNSNVLNGTEYTVVTNRSGYGKVSNPEEGIYLVVEQTPAEGYLPVMPFLICYPDCSGTEIQNLLTLRPKTVSFGGLKITKEVSGINAEYDRCFHVTVEFTEEYERAYACLLPDGESAVYRSGDTLTIKDDETIIISEIPDGTRYEVRELEENEDGYITEYENSSGRISGKEDTEVLIRNSRSKAPDTSDRTYSLSGMLMCLVTAAVSIAVSSLLIKCGRPGS